MTWVEDLILSVFYMFVLVMGLGMITAIYIAVSAITTKLKGKHARVSTGKK